MCFKLHGEDGETIWPNWKITQQYFKHLCWGGGGGDHGELGGKHGQVI